MDTPVDWKAQYHRATSLLQQSTRLTETYKKENDSLRQENQAVCKERDEWRVRAQIQANRMVLSTDTILRQVQAQESQAEALSTIVTLGEQLIYQLSLPQAHDYDSHAPQSNDREIESAIKMATFRLEHTSKSVRRTLRPLISKAQQLCSAPA